MKKPKKPATVWLSRKKFSFFQDWGTYSTETFVAVGKERQCLRKRQTVLGGFSPESILGGFPPICKIGGFPRLRRLLHSTGPKEILDYMRYPHLQCYLREALGPKLSTPKFIEFVKGWQLRLKERFNFIYVSARVRCMFASGICEQHPHDCAEARRKRYAQIVNGQGDYNIFAPLAHPAVCFAMLDGDEERVTKAVWKAVWKQVEPLVTGNTRFIREE